MMTSTLCTCTWLLLPCCVLITLSTGEHDFYQDDIPESSNIALKQFLIKYLEEQKMHYPSLFGSQPYKKHHLDLYRQKKKLLEALINKRNLAEILRKEKPKEWNYRQIKYNEPINELVQEREHYSPLYEMLNPFQSSLKYVNFKMPYFPHETNDDEDMNFQDDNEDGYDQNFDRGMKEEPLFGLHGSYSGSINENSKIDIQKPQVTIPEFTFKFEDSILPETYPFAVKPNDPRYYNNALFSLDNKDNSDFEKSIKNNTKWEQENIITVNGPIIREENPRNIESKFKDTDPVIAELERRTEYNPLFVPVNQDLNNDIYFIAIVAGCSAAAIFIFVLIALTWCRLKRGAKAAADIEYPAYGVTGPNKEISPSGDQRLAQSAQMYHFQHQKQQIIAMEKDPGSVSEAESEEENEEGDYTVYECPGLASTGEMEVKNPLFHDDPTPATPAQNNKEEDHI